ncbi:MAG: TonB-dependent receptor [Deltaproteobacteria bacterium]|nr:TonB-dependent receptor [Deltaproteobacteria bacterium]
MKRFFARALPAIAILAFATALSSVAQAQLTGTIQGSVFDEGGTPIKGVKLVAKSATNMGDRTVYSSADGSFRIIGLMPGDFEVTATAPGLRTKVQKGIPVGTSAVAEIYVIMEVAQKEEAETFVIETKAPVVNTSNAQVTEKFDGEFLNNLPLESRGSIQDVLGNQVAGAVGTDGSARVRGATSTSNAFQLEGFEVNDVNGGRGQLVTFKSLANLEMQTGGSGAENSGASGAVMNAVTKSGSNKFEYEVDSWHENSYLRLFLDEYDTNNFAMSTNINLNLSGPIVKDRVWFFTNWEVRNAVTDRGKDPTGQQPDPPRGSDNSIRSTGKVTWQMTPRNKLQLVYVFNRDGTKNGQGGFRNDRDSQWKRDSLNWFAGLIWESMLSDNLLFRSQLGVQQDDTDFGPELCRTSPQSCDAVNPLRQVSPPFEFQNWNTHSRNLSGTAEFKNTVEYFIEKPSIGNHNVKFTARFKAARSENQVTTPGDAIYVFNGDVPDSKRELFVNDPLVEPGRYGWAISNAQSTLFQFSLQDQFKLPNYRYLTLTPGVGLLVSDAQDGAGTSIIKFTTVTPNISAAWDVTHDGRTSVRASFSQKVDPGNLSIANYIGQSRTLRVCKWDANLQDFSKDCFFEGGLGGKTVGLPCGSQGVDANGNSCKTNLKVPRTWEYTFGVEREVAQGVGVGADFIYRDFRNPYEDRETNRIWNTAGTDLNPGGRFRNGSNRAVFDLETPSEAKRRYIGVTSNIRKREGALKLQFSYTWSHLQGNVVDGFQNPFLNNPAQDVFQYGDLPGDARHSIRSQATYQWTSWLSTGITYNYTSGGPINLQLFNTINGSFSDFRARRGFHPGVDLNDPRDDYAFRLPDLQTFNFQVRANLKPITRFNAQIYCDFLNLLALRTVTGYQTEVADVRAPLNPTTRQAPMRLRIGVDFKY